LILCVEAIILAYERNLFHFFIYLSFTEKLIIETKA